MARRRWGLCGCGLPGDDTDGTGGELMVVDCEGMSKNRNGAGRPTECVPVVQSSWER
jgi:hypothetical protein